MLTIRQARPFDCDAMCDIHREAIARHYAPTHGDDRAQMWADAVQPAMCQRWLASEMVIVAEEAGHVLGFAQFHGETGEIEISATAEAERRAVPGALLAVLETEARARGMGALRLSAMPGAERVYQAAGFRSGDPTSSRTGSGPPLSPMEKKLVYAEPRPERRRNGHVQSAPR